MDNAEFRNTIDRGLAAHWGGQYTEALACYRKALAARPNDAEAMSLAGLAMAQSGQAAQSLSLLQRAADLEPAQAGFRVNLAEGFLKSGKADEALRVLNGVIADFPDNMAAWEKSGDISVSRSNWDDAAAAWTQALALNPRVVSPALKLARLEISRGHHAAATSILEAAATRAPDDPTILALRAFVLTELRDWPSLFALASDWHARFPDDTQGWRFAARAAFEMGRHRQACDLFAHVRDMPDASASDLTAYASLALHALDFAAAADALDRAERLDPTHAEMLSNRALLLMYLGRLSDAQEYCERSLGQNPDNAPAYTILSRLRRGRLTDGERTHAARIAGDPEAHLDRRIPAAFAVAHALDAAGDTDAAFAAYERAHAIALERDGLEKRHYDRDRVAERAHRLRAMRGEATLAGGSAAGGLRPIFIFGMPRSGTTLFEAVLSAHPQVQGCGERPAMQQILREFIALDAAGRIPDLAQLRDWSAAYLRELPDVDGKVFATDKQPLNFEAVGLIARIFPDAALIHVRRNPVETGLSIFRQEFNKHWTFTHRLSDIGHYYGHYARQIAYWERSLPGRITTFQYEDFVNSFAAAAPGLLRVCGLEWDARCLEFQRSPRAIATFSTVQAREPVRNSNGRAIRYQKHLPALVSALEEAGVDLTTGGAQTSS